MPTYHYVQNQGKLIMYSRENSQKPQFGQFFEDSEAKYLNQIFLKNSFHSNWRLYLVQTSGQNPKKSLELFLRKVSKVSDFGLIWSFFREYLQIKNFSKIRLCIFSTFIVP